MNRIDLSFIQKRCTILEVYSFPFTTWIYCYQSNQRKIFYGTLQQASAQLYPSGLEALRVRSLIALWSSSKWSLLALISLMTRSTRPGSSSSPPRRPRSPPSNHIVGDVQDVETSSFSTTLYISSRMSFFTGAQLNTNPSKMSPLQQRPDRERTSPPSESQGYPRRTRKLSAIEWIPDEARDILITYRS